LLARASTYQCTVLIQTPVEEIDAVVLCAESKQMTAGTRLIKTFLSRSRCRFEQMDHSGLTW
jgi:hypothetical protein